MSAEPGRKTPYTRRPVENSLAMAGYGEAVSRNCRSLANFSQHSSPYLPRFDISGEVSGSPQPYHLS